MGLPRIPCPSFVAKFEGVIGITAVVEIDNTVL